MAYTRGVDIDQNMARVRMIEGGRVRRAVRRSAQSSDDSDPAVQMSDSGQGQDHGAHDHGDAFMRWSYESDTPFDLERLTGDDPPRPAPARSIAARGSFSPTPIPISGTYSSRWADGLRSPEGGGLGWATAAVAGRRDRGGGDPSTPDALSGAFDGCSDDTFLTRLPLRL